jgi:hypothetical protein
MTLHLAAALHQGGDVLAAVTAGASHPAVAGLLGLGAAGLAGSVVAMAWSVHVRQIRLAEQLARRQVLVAAGPGVEGGERRGDVPPATNGRAVPGRPDRLIIEGPDVVAAGEQARFRVPPGSGGTVVSWAAGGVALAQSPDPAHPDELLLIADQPGNLMVTVWVREGLAERRATKAVTAVPDATAAAPPVTLRVFLNAWGLVTVAVLIVGLAGALAALGALTSSGFIALAALLAALLGVIAAQRPAADGDSRPGAFRARPWELIPPAPRPAPLPGHPAHTAGPADPEPDHRHRVG